LPAIASGITGLLAGHIILSKLPAERKVIYLFSYGFFAFVAGYMWDFVFPVNKSIWTSSFVMVTSGLAAMLLAISLFFVDIRGHSRFTKPGIIFGSNAIAVYVLADVWGQFFYNIKYSGSSLNVHFMELFKAAGWSMKLGSLLFAILFISFNFVPAWFLYRRKIFIKL
jgi:predicted acyltransferase